jgi:hypothetical protein
MDAGTGRPSICIGGVDAKVKIYDAISGDLIEVGIHHFYLEAKRLNSELKSLSHYPSVLSAMEGFVCPRHALPLVS